jgi:hypothetical protein
LKSTLFLAICPSSFPPPFMPPAPHNHGVSLQQSNFPNSCIFMTKHPVILRFIITAFHCITHLFIHMVV